MHRFITVFITVLSCVTSNAFIVKKPIPQLHLLSSRQSQSPSCPREMILPSKRMNSTYSTFLKSLPSDKERERKKGATVTFSDLPSLPFSSDASSPTALVDYVLYIFTSDIGSIILGLIGMVIALYSRLSSIDYEASNIASSAAESMGQQARADLLGVFASGAVLLNGVSKLDVTSVLAESVILEGTLLQEPIYVNEDSCLVKNSDLLWAMNSTLDATPAKTAVLLVYDSSINNWIPTMLAGVVPSDKEMREGAPSIITRRDTPILDRFLRQEGSKESYLPTLQALPGKVEFTYLPQNCQETLALPISWKGCKAALVLGSDTAKSFSPRDIAWCQILARRLENSIG